VEEEEEDGRKVEEEEGLKLEDDEEEVFEPRVKKNNRDIQHAKNTTAPAIINLLLDLGGVFIYY